MFVRNAINQSLVLQTISCVWFLSISSLIVAQDALSQTKVQQPTVRYVRSSQAEVMAGPSADYYPTSIVKSGQSLEVHRETADGWLAITPPAGSFSWLPASQGLLLPGGRIVEVTEKSAVSWIGSELGTAKQYRWQVKLERGQQMSVIGEQTIPDPASGSKALWYKITPPAGEYRWIEAKATSEEPPKSSAAAEEIAADPAASDDSSILADPNDGEVIQASGQQPITSKQVRPAAGRTGTRSSGASRPVQPADRWADWHAMEFKNGSFTFPGMARMLGMQPTPLKPSHQRGSEDPFDLTASYSRARPTPLAAEKEFEDSTDMHGTEQREPQSGGPTGNTMAVRQSRGWRDPRQLREDRKRNATFDNYPDESTLAMDRAELSRSNADITDTGVMDASYEQFDEVGSAVVTAGATADLPSSRSSSTEQSWYGIEQAPSSRGNRAPAALQASLEEVQLELSAMVAGPEHTWNLAPLAEQARYFIEHGQDSLQRGQARLLLERIDSFASIARQSMPSVGAQAVGASNAKTTSNTGSVTGAGSTGQASWVGQVSGDSTTVTDANGARFDATGWLVPVHSSGRDMPTHALTNDAGRIIVYVTPAPGVNLTRFESQSIGVYGLRGYLPQLKTNHIQIQRVVRLQ